MLPTFPCSYIPFINIKNPIEWKVIRMTNLCLPFFWVNGEKKKKTIKIEREKKERTSKPLSLILLQFLLCFVLYISKNSYFIRVLIAILIYK